MSEAPAPLQRIGRYVLERKIASGGMADVYLATQTGAFGFAKRVALKVLKQEVATESDNVRMFLREAIVAAEFRHPNLVQVYEVGEERGKLFIAQELVNGISVATLMLLLAKKGRSIPIPMAAQVVLEVLDGLAYAHEARGSDGQALNVIHRDVTPHNILLSEEGTVKLVDFGIARAETALGKTQVAKVKGKFSYMAPEQWEASKNIDGRADLFSLGVSLYEMSTGSGRLFRGKSPIELHRAVTRDTIAPPGSRVPTYPDALSTVVMTALERDLKKRWPSARTMRTALADAMATQGWNVEARTLGKLVAYALDGQSIEDRWEKLDASDPLFVTDSDAEPDGHATEVGHPAIDAEEAETTGESTRPIEPSVRPKAGSVRPPDGASVLRAASLPGVSLPGPSATPAVVNPSGDYALGGDGRASVAYALQGEAPPAPAAPSPPAAHEPTGADPGGFGRVAWPIAAVLGWGAAAAMLGLYQRSQDTVSSLRSAIAATASVAPVPSAAPVAETLVILADPTLGSTLGVAWGAALQSSTPGRAVRVETGDALARMLLGASTLSLRAGLGDAEMVARAREQGIDLHAPSVEHIVGFDHAVVIVHPSNAVPSLTMAQLANLYAGHLTAWSPLHGTAPGAPTLVVGGAGAAPRSLLDELVLPSGGRGLRLSASARVMADEAAAVAEVAAHPGAVALVRLPYVNASVRAVPMAGAGNAPVAASRETVREGRYPLGRPVVLYTRGGPAGATEALLRIAVSPAGQSMLERAGYLSR